MLRDLDAGLPGLRGGSQPPRIRVRVKVTVEIEVKIEVIFNVRVKIQVEIKVKVKVKIKACFPITSNWTSPLTSHPRLKACTKAMRWLPLP